MIADTCTHGHKNRDKSISPRFGLSPTGANKEGRVNNSNTFCTHTILRHYIRYFCSLTFTTVGDCAALTVFKVFLNEFWQFLFITWVLYLLFLSNQTVSPGLGLFFNRQRAEELQKHKFLCMHVTAILWGGWAGVNAFGVRCTPPDVAFFQNMSKMPTRASSRQARFCGRSGLIGFEPIPLRVFHQKHIGNTTDL